MEEKTALEAYEEKQAEIEKLLKQIKAGLLKHDRGCNPRHHWGHVGDLNEIESELRNIRNRLLREGEYAEAAETGHHHRSLSRRKMIKAALS
jgi:molecular chaperone GrpE (heat shock protein)